MTCGASCSSILVLGRAPAPYVLDRRPARRTTTPGSQFTVEFDNAFGLVKGADVKVAGVRAGQDHRAARRPEDARRRWSTSRSTKKGFGSLREDAFCESRPQSLIGEYFVDCTPGTSRAEAQARRDDPGRAHRLDDPRRPAQQHHAPPLPRAAADHPRRARRRRRRPRRRPQRRRSAAPSRRCARPTRCWRSSPTRTRCSATSRRNADTVIGDLADNRKDVGRFVTETERPPTRLRRAPRATSPPACSACPTFLRELRPTMAELGASRRRADARRCATSTRRPASSTRFLENLGPFAESSRVNVRIARRDRRNGRPGDRGRASRPSPSSTKATRARARARQQPRRSSSSDLDDRKPRRREGPALAGRPGLHGLRGGPPVRLRPDAWRSTSSTRTATSSRSTSSPRSAATTRTPTRSRSKDEAGPGLLLSAAPRSSARTSRASRTPTRPTPASTTPARRAPTPSLQEGEEQVQARRKDERRRARTRPASRTSRRRSRSCSRAAAAGEASVPTLPNVTRSASRCPTLPQTPPASRSVPERRRRAVQRRRPAGRSSTTSSSP